MKKWLVFASIAMAAGSAMAQISWMGNSYLFVQGGREGGGWYAVSAAPSTGAPILPATLDLYAGDQIGFETQFSPATYGYNAEVGYAVNGVWNTAQLDWYSNSGGEYYNNAVYRSSPAEQFIPVTLEMDGATLEFFYATTDSDGNQVQWDSNGGDNYSVNLHVTPPPTPVPEPATMSLLGLGALAMVLRRKLRK
ncbi:MAG: PEP-CTERM sorting domain-containing protein [Verrucomicrobiota bacterium]|jgi:hypothetical protein|nr:PEP-CTERM sorting domain-containing protein [Verrucomicrobiota bacterium]